MNNKTRPLLAFEQPQWLDNCRFFIQNFKRNFVYRKKPFNAFDEKLQRYFSKENRVFSEDIGYLVHYFYASFCHYSYHNYSRANFPGLPGIQGRDSDSIEGAARIYPLLAAYLVANRNNDSVLKERIEIQKILRSGFLALTDSAHKGYWGVLKSYQQTVCETADFALALWLSKDMVWSSLEENDKQQIVRWLKQINTVETVNNNWHLFVLLTQTVLNDLTGEQEVSRERYQKIKALYVGSGWFRDGPAGNFDYYNSWGFHYPLFWIDQINPEFDRQFIREAATAFCQNFKYLFTARGFSFFGRSAPYRFAAPCALISNMIQKNQVDGQVKRAVSTLYQFFILHGAIQFGTFTQGLFAADRRILDYYSGSGSSLWSLRSLILLLYSGMDMDSVAEIPLEVEKKDFDVSIPAIALRIIGHKETGEVIAIFKNNNYKDFPFTEAVLEEQGIYPKILEKIIGRSTRSRNNLLRKGVTTYSSKMNLFLK